MCYNDLSDTFISKQYKDSKAIRLYNLKKDYTKTIFLKNKKCSAKDREKILYRSTQVHHKMTLDHLCSDMEITVRSIDPAFIQ